MHLLDTHSSRIQSLILPMSALIALLPGVSLGLAQRPASVRVASGRVFHAEVSARTDENRLWLSFRTGSAELLRPIAWDRVVAAGLDGERLAGRQLRTRLLEASTQSLAAGAPTVHDDEAATWTSTAAVQAQQAPPSGEEEIPLPPATSGPTMAHEALDALFAPPRIAAVRLDSHIANWDADVEADGLILQAVPIDATGHVIPVRGTLQVELIGARRIAFQDGPHKRGRDFGRLGNWTRQVLPADVHPDGAWYKLPFQGRHPEFDVDVFRKALVHARLVVPGEGTFEASLDGVRLRPFAPTRDALQRDTGRRFFPTERTGRGKRAR